MISLITSSTTDHSAGFRRRGAQCCYL